MPRIAIFLLVFYLIAITLLLLLALASALFGSFKWGDFARFACTAPILPLMLTTKKGRVYAENLIKKMG